MTTLAFLGRVGRPFTATRKRKKPFTGLHIVGEIQTEERERLKSLHSTKGRIRRIIKRLGLKELGSFYHQFPRGGGFTGLVSLVESHIAVHTWPELGYVTLDVYLCNYRKDNADRCQRLFDEISKIFKPFRTAKRAIRR